MDEDRQGTDNSFRGHDPRLIDFESSSERAYWCKALGVSEPELYAALIAAGNTAQAVKDWLRAKSGGETPGTRG